MINYITRETLGILSEPLRTHYIFHVVQKSPISVFFFSLQTPVIMREKAKADKCSDVASARSSKVLDMVKNYQKLQVS